MSELVLPHTIDAGTEIVAAEHQANYVAIRDLINGDLEGGSGASGNIKADGITARELANGLLTYGLPSSHTTEGVFEASTDLLVTAGAGLVLNYAAGSAWVRDDSGVIATGALIPVTVIAGSVNIAANASGNPRIDQVILTMTGYGTGTVSVLQGTPTAGATLNNRNGAAALPNDAIRLADILMANGFAGPFVIHTSIRNRQPWSKPMVFNLSAANNYDIVVDSVTDKLVKMDWAFTLSGHADLRVIPQNYTGTAIYSYIRDGSYQTSVPASTAVAATGGYHHSSGFYLGSAGAATVAGGHRMTGTAEVGFNVGGTPGHFCRSNNLDSSNTLSGNHVIEVQQIANLLEVSAGNTDVIAFLRFIVVAGDITGRLVIERI